MSDINWGSLIARSLEMDTRDYKLLVGADQTEAVMGLCPIPLQRLRDKVFTKGSRLLARASPLTVRRKLNSSSSPGVCRSRGNVLVRLPVLWRNVASSEQWSGKQPCRASLWCCGSAMVGFLPCSVGQSRPQKYVFPVDISALLL